MAKGIAISDYDLANLQSMYPLCNFNTGFSAQDERFILLILKGLEPGPAAVATGRHPNHGYRLIKDERIKAALDMLRAKEFNDIRITRDSLNQMLLEAHAKAANATEEIAAIRELGKMNGLYAPQQTVNMNLNTEVKSLRQLQQLNDHELLQMAGGDIVLEPSDYEVVDGDAD